eukprot:scaffold122050_cov52-Attheya_sp.AAC.1
MEGKQVLAELGKMVGQNVSTLKQQVFLKPPPKRANYTPPPIKEEFRFGRVVLREMCFFTKQIITLNNNNNNTSNNNRTTNININSNNNINNNNNNHGASRDGGGGPSEEGNPAFLSKSSSFDPNNPNHNHKNGRYYHDVGDNAWSKPILIREVMVSAAELCPPMSAKDEAGDPAVGQSLEQTFDVVLKRTLAESAKTNTGRLLQSVFGQVPFKQRPRRDTPPTATATNTTATTADSNSNSNTATHNKHASSCSTPHQNNLSSHGSTANAASSSIMITASNSNSFGSLVSASDPPRQRSRASNYH